MHDVNMNSNPVHFIPSRVEGADGITAVTVHPDRLELHRGARIEVHRFVNIADFGRTPRWLGRWLLRMRIRPRFLPVADRYWFHDPQDMFFVFYTTPRIKIFMPHDEVKEVTNSCFGRVRDLLIRGGFNSFDLG